MAPDRPGDAGQSAEDQAGRLPLRLGVVADAHQDDRDDHRQHEVRHADAQDGREPAAERLVFTASSCAAVEDERDVSAPGQAGQDDVDPPGDIAHRVTLNEKFQVPGFKFQVGRFQLETWNLKLGTAKNDPDGIRTRVAALKGLCPRPLDDRANA